MPLNGNERAEVCVCRDKDAVFGHSKGQVHVVVG
jgi:hypothetical protein